MPFTKKEVNQIYSIFKHLEPRTIESIQTYTKNQLNRTGVTFGVQNWKNEYTMLFQFFKNLSPARIKILDKRKKSIPYEIYIKSTGKNFTCVGWKT